MKTILNGDQNALIAKFHDWELYGPPKLISGRVYVTLRHPSGAVAVPLSDLWSVTVESLFDEDEAARAALTVLVFGLQTAESDAKTQAEG